MSFTPLVNFPEITKVNPLLWFLSPLLKKFAPNSFINHPLCDVTKSTDTEITQRQRFGTRFAF